ncbi:hypothetical protein KMW28_12605 [Flammeovirga yaeyamensis]|uniref:DUF1735 domain-containing protein n=1 Tax=Flammeovirga yaeyamensis TaxID=367791 RepID=A0AAX1MYS4_9BACT|nr:hypothetical protein [Flammeovirga yaeyamensis]MBB3695990.1 hypothetical protein [Flammeovirga yaeyamensis]NMF34676.1 hypothetical protein [Flammeovirga yaeyamensis]QWG00494.1 hypothetical protein KMW28_12605 [Flammeovirga yaeyamensis]
MKLHLKQLFISFLLLSFLFYSCSEEEASDPTVAFTGINGFDPNATIKDSATTFNEDELYINLKVTTPAAISGGKIDVFVGGTEEDNIALSYDLVNLSVSDLAQLTAINTRATVNIPVANNLAGQSDVDFKLDGYVLNSLLRFSGLVTIRITVTDITGNQGVQDIKFDLATNPANGTFFLTGTQWTVSSAYLMKNYSGTTVYLDYTDTTTVNIGFTASWGANFVAEWNTTSALDVSVLDGAFQTINDPVFLQNGLYQGAWAWGAAPTTGTEEYYNGVIGITDTQGNTMNLSTQHNASADSMYVRHQGPTSVLGQSYRIEWVIVKQ